MSKLNSIAAVFIGGAIGSIARYGIALLLDATTMTASVVELSLVTIVNLSGAVFLGFVNSSSYFQTGNRRAFFGSGVAGGFTTMSGVAIITAGQDFGLGPVGWLFWLAVVFQFVLGVFAYRFGFKTLGLVK